VCRAQHTILKLTHAGLDVVEGEVAHGVLQVVEVHGGGFLVTSVGDGTTKVVGLDFNVVTDFEGASHYAITNGGLLCQSQVTY